MIGKILLEDGNFYLEFTKVVKKCFGCKPQEELVKIRLHPDDEKLIENNPLNKLEILSGTKNKVDFELVYGKHGVYYPKIHWEYIEDDDNEHIVEANGMVDQVPDVRKMVEWIDKEILLNPYYADSPRLREGANMVKVKLQQYTPTSSQTEISDKWKEYQDWLNEVPEISDEEIDKAANYFYPLCGEQSKKAIWVNGCKWYKEKLKSKK